MGSTGAGASTGTSTSGGLGSSSGSSTAQASYGVVQSIDPLPRNMAGTSGVGVSGAAAAGGSTGAGTGSGATTGETPYRITVRMDDGTSQSIVVDTMPSYKIGDRVRYSSGVLSTY